MGIKGWHVATALAIALSSALPAKPENRYVNMGNDANGNPVLLDNESVNGARYNLIIQVEGSPAVLSLTASCRTNRLTVNQLTIFDRQGNQIFDNQSSEELRFPPNSPTARSLAEVCRRSQREPYN